LKQQSCSKLHIIKWSCNLFPAADVLTIENSRSGNAMIEALNKAGYKRDIGPGVYDVHSPVVPTVDFMADKLAGFVSTGILGKDARRIWVNPDCGLKTRDWKEVLPSLRNMVQAAEVMRCGAQGTHLKPSKDTVNTVHSGACCGAACH
jgi:5-methyltetrahydropteroyltriglutamate--homocysteine methyltransferase